MNVPIIIAFFAIFFIILIVIGYLTKKWAQGNADFTIADREVGMVISTSGITAIAFAGTSIALAPSFAMMYGLMGTIAWGGILAMGFAAYAWIFGSTFRRCGARTLAEWMETKFGGRTRTLVAIGSIVGLCGIMANNIASFASSLTAYTGIPTWVSIALCFVVMIMFTFMSGMHAVNMTNLFQMIIGLIALPLFAFLLFKAYGGVDFISQNWPGGGNWVTTGFTGNSLPVFTLKYPSVLSFITLMGIFLIWGSNYEYIRIACARSEKVVKWSYTLSAVIQMLCVYVPLAFIGLFAAAAKSGMFIPNGAVPTVAAYGIMLLELASAVAAFALIASMAASLSTASTALMGATTTASRDVYQRNFKPNATDKELLASTRFIMVGVGILTAILTFFPGGPTYLFAFANSWLGPPAVLVLLGVFWKRFTTVAGFWAVLLGMITMATLTATELAGIFSIAPYMHLSMAGLFVTLAVGIIVSLATQPKYYGRSDWDIDPETGKREDVKLEELDMQILELLRKNITTMVEIVDYLNIDSRYASESVERLDRGGYIKREALTGARFYNYKITEKGEKALPEQTQEEKELRKVNLTPMLLTYLKELKKSEDEGLKIFADKNITSLQIVSLNSMLERVGYIKQHGHLRRHYKITQEGIDVVKKYNN
jgi:SSS family solute:Na+ symporter